MKSFMPPPHDDENTETHPAIVERRFARRRLHSSLIRGDRFVLISIYIIIMRRPTALAFLLHCLVFPFLFVASNNNMPSFEVGKYILSEVFDANEVPIQLPVGRFEMTLTSWSGETESATSDGARYGFSMKIGNSMGGSFTLLKAEDGTVKMGPMRSTMMMPSEELYALEITFSKIVSEVNSVVQSEGKLTWSGAQGRLAFQKE